LIKASNYYNKLRAWRDWQTEAEQARQKGYGDLVDLHRPTGSAGWRTIDKAIQSLRKAFQLAESFHNRLI